MSGNKKNIISKWKYYKPNFEYNKLTDLFYTAWFGHIFFAYDLIRNTKPKKIVELGTHYGHSFFSFCQAVKDEEYDAKLFAVDTWKGDEHSGFYGKEVFDQVQQIKTTFYSNQKIELIKKTFDEALKDFEDNSIDLLHIDGLHTYEGVNHDFESWFCKIKSDGVILLHDIVVKRDNFGVYKLWDKLKNNYKTIEFHHSHGLGVLFKNPKKFEEYVNYQNVWQHYSTVSENEMHIELLRSRDIVNLKNQDIEKLNQVIYKKDQNIFKRDERIKKLNQIIHKKNQELKTIKSSKIWKLREKYLNFKRSSTANKIL